MRSVLLVQPSMQPPGGGNGVAAWMLQALVPEYCVTVLSWQPVSVEPINRFFGTALRTTEFDTIVMPASWRAVPDHVPLPLALIKSALIMRFTRHISDEFDVIVGAHNETDYGRRGIQYVHYPTYLRPRPAADLRWYHRSPSLLGSYYWLADWLADFSFERLTSNVTLANSDWTAAHLRRFLGVATRTVYPPVVDAVEPLPWDRRNPRFLAIGRLSPEKEFDRVMRVLARVRTTFPDVTLTIIGSWDRHVRRHRNYLRALAASMGSWIKFREDLSRDEIRSLMASSRYGLHGMREEHFGMAPAEMVRAGMIVWVPNGGGQVEIVDREPALMYATEEEGAMKIARVLGSAAEQRRLLEGLAAGAGRFSSSRFVSEIRTVVQNFTE